MSPQWFAFNPIARGLAAGAAFCIVTGPAFSATDTPLPPFIPIERQYLPLPAGMQPLWPTFAAGGPDIIFQNGADWNVWIIASDGTGLQCITCDLPDRPKQRGGGFAHAFPDGKRLLLTDGVASASDGARPNGWILECGISLRACQSHRYLPIDMTADRSPAAPAAQRRTFHLSPDGTHLGWMNVRSDGTVMVVARLERHTDKYVASDPRAVNPMGPRSPGDDHADRWENLSQLYELKSFTPDGKGILAVGTPNNNVDVLRIDLSTGRTTRLTAHPDWDEDSSLSPDQRLFVLNSWRGAERLDALAWIPQIRGFTGLMIGAAIAPYYVSTWAGFQCDLSPWLLPARGDDGGRAMGQPIDVYGGTLTAANNLHGQRVWSSDSTMLLLNERTRTQSIASPNRIAIAHLGRAPTRPVAVSATKVGGWAVPAALYQGPHFADRTAVVRGKGGGRATITYKGKLGGGGASTSVEFDRFSDDGATFVTGTMSGASASQGVGEKRAWTLLADVAVSGRHTGVLKMDLTIDNAARPLPAMAGSLFAVYDGEAAPPLPKLGPCYDVQPKSTPLNLKLTRAGRKIRALVTADIHGDVRPVMNAKITYGAFTVATDARGRAILPRRRGYPDDIVATAGDTFVAARKPVPG
jgi:hypothetical protein